MKDNYPACLAAVLKYEGGYVNDPRDPGGATNYGVTQRVYTLWRASMGLPNKAVREIAMSEVEKIYARDYWGAINGDALARGVDLAVFDPAVNSGPARARAWLAASAGADDLTTIKRLCAKRLSFMQALRTWSTFGKGWARRVADVEALAIKMAAGNLSPAILNHEAAKASRSAANSKAGAKVSTAGTAGGTAAAHTAVSHDLWPYLLGALVLAGAITVAVCIFRAHVDNTRAAALREASNG